MNIVAPSAQKMIGNRDAPFELGWPLVFDLTTSAKWAGPPVGVVRVERELGRYALTITDRPITFSYFDKRLRTFLEIDRAIVPRIIAGELTITDNRAIEEAAPFFRQPRRHLVKAAASLASHGKEIANIVLAKLARESPRRPATRRKKKSTVKLTNIEISQACPRELPLDRVTIVSCGLDWQQKNIAAIYKSKQSSNFQYVAICYDLIAWKLPHLTTPKYFEFLLAYFGELTWAADKLMCISECTARDLRDFCAEYLTPRPALGVFPLGGEVLTRTEDTALPGNLQPQRYILYVSTFEARKNHRLLYRTWERMLSQDRTRGLKLVFVGHKGWLTSDLFSEMERNPAVQNHILVLNALSDATLAALYRSCFFTVYPSLYEGYGLPVAESLGYGKICLASNTGSIPEIVGDLLPMLDPFNEDAWYREMTHLIEDAPYFSAMERRVRDKHRTVTWSESARVFFSSL